MRDLWLGKPVVDWDIAVFEDAHATAQGIAQAVDGRLVPLDTERGIFRIVLDSQVIDITQADESLEHDLLRRDLTVNALGLPLTAGGLADWRNRVVDPTGGLQDLENRNIRAVSEANLTDDPLRLLRVFRFASQLEFHVEPATLALVRRHAQLIREVAPERVLKELYLTLAGPVTPLLGAWRDSGLLEALLPELTPMRDIPPNDHHHLGLLDHTLEVVRQLESLDLALLPESDKLQAHLDSRLTHEHRRWPWLKFGALLHDVGKPDTFTLDQGRPRFLAHEKVGADLAETLCERLRMATDERLFVVNLVRHHLRPGLLTQDAPPSKRALYRYFRDLGDDGLSIALLGWADRLATQGPAITAADNQRFLETVRLLVEQAFAVDSKAPPLVDGRQLMAALGLAPGPEIGRLLEGIREAQATGEVATADEAMQWAREHRS